MEQTHLKYLLERYLGGSATEAELDELLAWYHSFNHEEVAWPAEGPEEEAAVFRRLQQNILDKTRPVIQKNPQRLIWLTSAAALFIVALATSLYFYRSRAIVNRKSTIVNQEILPGYNQATLTLTNGKTINLDSAQSGIIVQDEDIRYNNGKKVQGVIPPFPGAEPGSRAEKSLPSSLTLTTPKGGQYQVILPDGTKVWLNAASKIKYPSKFIGNKREVFLEGEAYFEVNNRTEAQGDGRAVSPFIIKSKNQEITVLGTSFNVAAYADETNERTTLITGKVQVRSQNLQRKTYHLKLLEPNQQAIVKGDSLTVSKVDISREIAWHNGKFSFEGKTFTQVMDELSRWYNLEVVYTNGVPDERFFGSAFRNANLSTLLKILKSDNVDYRMANGHMLIINNLKPERKNPMK